jgi:uncharacterized protein (DUF2342 family)
MPQNYRIGNIKGENIAIGDHAKASSSVRIKAEQSAMQVEALQQIQNLIALLPGHADVIDDPDQVQADAKAAKVALSKKSLNRARIEKLISRLTVGLAGVTALANSVDAVQAAVSHLFT